MDTPLLKVGADEPAVGELKHLLNAQLRPSPGLHVGNHYFGPDTRKAVERFQTERQLNVSGQVDADTWNALGGSKSGHEAGHPHHKTLNPDKAGAEGVKNHHARAANKHELAVILQDVGEAERWINKAVQALTHPNSSVWQAFKKSFRPNLEMMIGGTDPTPAQLRGYASVAVKRFAIMQAKLKEAVKQPHSVFLVQDSEMWVNKQKGEWAYAAAQFGDFITFSKPRYFDPHRTQAERVKIVVHESAHYAWDAGHAYPGGAQTNLQGTSITFTVVDWHIALQGADRYADFAQLIH